MAKLQKTPKYLFNYYAYISMINYCTDLRKKKRGRGKQQSEKKQMYSDRKMIIQTNVVCVSINKSVVLFVFLDDSRVVKLK